MVFTTNKALSTWGRVLHDDDLAAVILDRVFERGRHVKLDGPSIRTLHLHSDVLGGEDGLRVSEMGGSEFPEPTAPGTEILPMRCTEFLAMTQMLWVQ